MVRVVAAENYITGIIIIVLNIVQNKTVILNCNNISQYYCFFLYF